MLILTCGLILAVHAAGVSEEPKAKELMVFTALILFWLSLLMTHFPLYFSWCWPAFGSSDLLMAQLLWHLPTCSPSVSWGSVSMARTAAASWDWGSCATGGFGGRPGLRCDAQKPHQAEMTRLCQIIELVRLEKAFKSPRAFMDTAPPSCSPLNCLQVPHPQGYGALPWVVMPISLGSLCSASHLFPWRNFP